MKTRLPFLLLATLFVALLAACGGGSTSGNVPADAIAQVGSMPITKASFTALMNVACARYKAQGQACPKVGTPTYSSLRDSAVTFLVQQEELAQEAKKLGVTVTQSDIQKQVDQITKTYYQGSKAKLDCGAEEGRHHARAARAVRAPAEPARPERAEQGDVGHRHLDRGGAEVLRREQGVVRDAEDARGAAHPRQRARASPRTSSSRLKNGANFATLAKKYSKDTGSAAQGGKICVAHGGTSGACQQTVAPFDKAAFSLKTNEVGLVHSVYGWHVIQPIGSVKPAHVQTFPQVKAQIQANLASQQKQTAWQAWLAKMAKDFKGKVAYQTGYEPATTTTPTTPAPTTTG